MKPPLKLVGGSDPRLTRLRREVAANRRQLARDGLGLDTALLLLEAVQAQTAAVQGLTDALRAAMGPITERAGGFALHAAGDCGRDGGMLRLHTPVEPAAPQLALALESWDCDMRGRLGHCDIHRRKSVKAAREMVEAAMLRDFADLDPKTATPKAMAWLQSIIDPAKPSTRKTARNKLSQIIAFAAYLKLSGHITVNPFEEIGLPKASKRRRFAGARAFTWDQCETLEALADASDIGSANARKYGPLRGTFYRFLKWTGLRYSEARRQLWDDIDLDRGVMIVSGDKSDRNDEVPLAAEVIVLLRAWRDACKAPTALGVQRQAAGYLFPCTPSHHSLTEDMAKAGIPGIADGKKGQWHRFRKTLSTEFARAYVRGGVHSSAAQRVLRHASSALTDGVYTDLDLEEYRGQMKNLGRNRENGFTPCCGRGENPDNAGAKTDAAMKTTSQNDATGSAGVSAKAGSLSSSRSQCSHTPAVPCSAVAAEKWSRGESTPRLNPPATPIQAGTLCSRGDRYALIPVPVSADRKTGTSAPAQAEQKRWASATGAAQLGGLVGASSQPPIHFSRPEQSGSREAVQLGGSGTVDGPAHVSVNDVTAGETAPDRTVEKQLSHRAHNAEVAGAIPAGAIPPPVGAGIDHHISPGAPSDPHSRALDSIARAEFNARRAKAQEAADGDGADSGSGPIGLVGLRVPQARSGDGAADAHQTASAEDEALPGVQMRAPEQVDPRVRSLIDALRLASVPLTPENIGRALKAGGVIAILGWSLAAAMTREPEPLPPPVVVAGD